MAWTASPDLAHCPDIPHLSPGRVDFHSCPVAYVTFILEAGATVKEGQTLARHATPDLTMNVYARARSERLAVLAEEVRETVLSGLERALFVPHGMESVQKESPNSFALQELGPVNGGGGGGNRTRVPEPFR